MISRVLVVPLNYSHRQNGFISAFQKIFGEDNIEEFDYIARQSSGQSKQKINEELVETAIAHSPDWIWLQVQMTGIIEPWAISKIKQHLPKCVITHWMGDLRTEVEPSLAAICGITDATLLSNTGQMQMYLNAGAKRVHYTQIGLDWDEDVLGIFQGQQWVPPFRVPDVVFCGGYYEHFPGAKLRLEAIRALMAEKIDVGVVSDGHWPSDIPVVGSCHVKQQNAVYKRAKVVLSINNFNDIANYYSDRQLIAMASGTPVVCYEVPGLFDDIHAVKSFTRIDQMIQLVNGLLTNKDERLIEGYKAKSFVIANHTWQVRLTDLLPFIERWRP